MGKWLKRLLRFRDFIEKSFGAETIGSSDFVEMEHPDAFKRKIQDWGIPKCIEDFYCTEACKLDFSFGISGLIAGGCSLVNPNLQDWFETEQWGVCVDHPETVVTQLLKNTLSFFDFGDGNVAGLDMRSIHNEPPVVLIQHEWWDVPTEQPVIARNFSSFLYEWERLYYIDPLNLRQAGCCNSDGLLDHTLCPNSIKKLFYTFDQGEHTI